MDSGIKKDIETSKISKRIDLQMVDDKLSVIFTINDSTDVGNGIGSYTSYNKIFDDFESFNSYAELFFKEVL